MNVQHIMDVYLKHLQIGIGDLPYHSAPYREVPEFPDDWFITVHDYTDEVGEVMMVVKIMMEGQIKLARATGEIYSIYTAGDRICRDAFWDKRWVEVEVVTVTTTTYKEV